MRTSEKIYYAREKWHTSFTELAFHYDITEEKVKELYHQEQIKRLPSAYSPSDSIACLNLSTRAFFCLKRRYIDTIEQLIKLTREELERIPNCGSQTTDEILDVIEVAKTVLKRRDLR